MTSTRIPFNRVGITGGELDLLAQAVASGYLAGDGTMARECERLLQAVTGSARVLLTPSCTSALEIAATLAGIKPGDEVVLPSFTFVSTANAFVLRGARPVFADVLPATLGLDPASVEACVTPRTRAVAVVHYAGVACEMDELVEICGGAEAHLIEDNAHGLFGTYRGRPLGSLGALATLSFHETKNISCGEGGALLVNDAALIERAEIIREKGTDRSKFFRGLVDKYTWVDIGSSHLPSELQAAFLLAQLRASTEIQADRMRIWNRYRSALAGWARRVGAVLPTVPADRQHPAHLFYVLMPDVDARDRMIRWLGEHDIQSVFHYVPLHLSPMGQSFGGRPGMLPVTESISERLLRLPLFRGLTDSEQDRVIDSVLAFPSAA
ncbi:MAG: dTDP-4-amino-4,6-dideoxygalactose transaminase [Chloroflexi bacterium]|nr:MAG: dTDP-4-amino-4,6-dideoxygalactose transaminase [Chloroflexota bacterium]